MSEDELTAPLGAGTPERRWTIGRWPWIPILGGAVAFVIVAATLWVVVVDDPLGGEPVAIVSLTGPDAARPASEPPVSQRNTGEENGTGRGTSAAPGAKPGAKVIAIAPGSQAQQPPSADGIVIRDPTEKSSRIIPVGPDPALIEESPYGPLPRIAADGRRPMDVYGGPPPPGDARTPRIAIIVSGLGLSQTGTQEAIRKLPPGVTLAFAPYGNSLGRWVARARQQGHETILQIPLEPFDYPNNDPGPHTLLTTLSVSENRDRLHWLMARMTAYAGIMNHMGARFTAARTAFEPFAREITARGLYFIDDGASSRSLSAEIAEAAGLPFLHGDVALDATPAKDEIDARLLQLETIAVTRGAAVGVAAALPVVVDRIADWARTAESRGFVLTPASFLTGARNDAASMSEK